MGESAGPTITHLTKVLQIEEATPQYVPQLMVIVVIAAVNVALPDLAVARPPA